jgi:hypothetical protein
MLTLTSHLLLTSDGWEHISNMSSYDEADVIKRQLELQSDAYEYKIGAPKGGAKYTSERLTEMGFVGFYRRGGRTVQSIPSALPSSPIFVDEPDYQEYSPTPPSTDIHDKPLDPIMAAA